MCVFVPYRKKGDKRQLDIDRHPYVKFSEKGKTIG